ncbi:MAG: DUF4864 domain-containing protein [Arenibacterium sp.]
MQKFFLTMGFVLGLATAAWAQNTDIETTIDSQIEAFLADDFNRAFTFASPNIQQMFRTPENFGVMVRRGYPMVWRPTDVKYLELRQIDGALWQKVQITDAQGQVHYLDYQMIEMDSGWKINAVQLLRQTGVSA